MIAKQSRMSLMFSVCQNRSIQYIGVDNGQLWSILLWTLRNVLRPEWKARDYEAKLSVSNIF